MALKIKLKVGGGRLSPSPNPSPSPSPSPPPAVSPGAEQQPALEQQQQLPSAPDDQRERRQESGAVSDAESGGEGAEALGPRAAGGSAQREQRQAQVAEEEPEDGSVVPGGAEYDARESRANAILLLLQRRKEVKRQRARSRPVYLAAPSAGASPPAAPDHSKWEALTRMPQGAPELAGVFGAGPRHAGSLIAAPVLDALWQEAKMQQAQLRARAQKRLDIEARMKEERAREIQALREQAQEEEEKRRQKEEDAKREAERIKQEAREKARLEREQLEQTIDMDAQGAVMDAQGDEDDEDDLGGF
jgi:DNA repair exonuclease SbcCD ATPase subunit